MRMRSWRPAMPSISGPRSTAASNVTSTPFVSGAPCSLLIALPARCLLSDRAMVGPGEVCPGRSCDRIGPAGVAEPSHSDVQVIDDRPRIDDASRGQFDVLRRVSVAEQGDVEASVQGSIGRRADAPVRRRTCQKYARNALSVVMLNPDHGNAGLARSPNRERYVADDSIALPCCRDDTDLDIGDKQNGMSA